MHNQDNHNQECHKKDDPDKDEDNNKNPDKDNHKKTQILCLFFEDLFGIFLVWVLLSIHFKFSLIFCYK